MIFAMTAVEDKTISQDEDTLEILRESVRRFREGDNMPLEKLEEILWQVLSYYQGTQFFTSKGLEFTYTIRGNEMFVSRKKKSITRASVRIAFFKAIELGAAVAGPKKLGTYGASYIYPVFLWFGLIPKSSES